MQIERPRVGIKRRKSCSRRRRRRRGGPHGGKNRRNVLYGGKNSTGKEQRGGSSAPEFLPRLPLFSSFFQPVPFFVFLSLSIARYLALKNDDTHMCRTVGRMKSSRVIGERLGMDSENRYEQTRAHPSIALPDYRLEQKNADKRGVSSPFVHR